VSVCPKDALYVGFAMPKPFAKSQQRIVARADLTWPEELLVGVVAFVATQFAWRGAWFTEGVPLLLAVGLGVITAVLLLLLLRLVRRHELTFQSTPLKQSGRWTPAGRRVAIAASLFVGLAVHSGVCQWRRDALYETMKAISPKAAKVEVENVLASADRALSWEVFDDPFTRELRAMLLWRLGREAEAAPELLSIYESTKKLDLNLANLNLARACMSPLLPRLDVAEQVLRGLLQRPLDQRTAAQAASLLEAVVAMRQK
jgi:hypothetical protein